ncbi:MAG TPA: Ig-like domain-containing protein, partial [Mycobacteriales bacterium]|nr:Ig-like domain-containing protein [Mycobacteriales bacterium]
MLLNGRASLGPEANAPNTIGSTCADGASGTYHSDESLDRLVIQSVDGTDLAAGKTARISATVWAYAGFSSDRLDLYSSPSADSPSWTLLATLTPTAASAQTLSTTFTLPFSPRQAIRGVFRYGGTAAPCSGGPFDDHDDLVFEVVVPPDTVAPTASITSPANGASLIPPVQVSVQGSDDRGVTRLELYEGTTLLGAFNAGTGSLTLNPGLGSHTYTALAYDAAGNVGTSAPVTFTAVPDTAPPTISITYPNPAQTVAGDVPVMANASDNVGVTRVEFYDGSSLYWTATTPPWNGVLHTFNLPNGAHTVRAIAYDAAGNSGSAAVDFVVNNDHTAPDVAVTSPVAGSFIAGIVTLTASATDNVGVTRVEFSENGILIGQATQTSGTSTWTLKWDTGSIADGLVLTLTARAWDGAGNSATSPGVTVTKKDVVAPSTTVTSPGAGATISGTVNIVATATDDVKVTRLEFYDGAIYLGLANSIAGSTYSLAWNTKTVANGGHSLFTKAYDAAGNVATSGVVAVTVNNDLTPPSTTLTSPADGATVQDVIMLSAVATDDVGVQTVRFKIDGTTVIASGTQTGGTTSWTASWSSWGAANGTHTVASEAVDTSGNLASSAPVSITVSNVDTTPPMTAITSPATGATLSGTVTLVASASDNVGVTRVEFWDGATLLGAGSRSGTSYSFAWNTSGAASGSHSLTSRAYDAANNVGPSAAVSVNVATAPP